MVSYAQHEPTLRDETCVPPTRPALAGGWSDQGPSIGTINSSLYYETAVQGAHADYLLWQLANMNAQAVEASPPPEGYTTTSSSGSHTSRWYHATAARGAHADYLLWQLTAMTAQAKQVTLAPEGYTTTSSSGAGGSLVAVVRDASFDCFALPTSIVARPEDGSTSPESTHVPRESADYVSADSPVAGGYMDWHPTSLQERPLPSGASPVVTSTVTGNSMLAPQLQRCRPSLRAAGSNRRGRVSVSWS